MVKYCGREKCRDKWELQRFIERDVEYVRRVVNTEERENLRRVVEVLKGKDK